FSLRGLGPGPRDEGGVVAARGGGGGPHGRPVPGARRMAGGPARLASIAALRPPDSGAERNFPGLMPTHNPPDTSALRIIPRDQHPISRRAISPNALRVLYRLHEAGHRACLV